MASGEQRRRLRSCAFKVLISAALMLPLGPLAYLAFLDYRNTRDESETQIDFRLHLLSEHAKIAIQTIELALAEVEDGTRDLSDQEIAAAEQRLHRQLAKIAAAFPLINWVAVLDRSGRPLVTNLVYPASDAVHLTRENHFNVPQVNEFGLDGGLTLVAPSRFAESNLIGFFRRRSTQKLDLTGSVEVAILPAYFERYYAEIGHSSGTFAAMARADGTVFARYPAGRDESRPEWQRALSRPQESGGAVVFKSMMGGAGWQIGVRQIEHFPIYLLAGTEDAVTQREWRSKVEMHLFIGLPPIVLCLVLAIALQRARRRNPGTTDNMVRQQKQLEAVGRMAANIGQDFQSLLTVIRNALGELRIDLERGHLRKIATIEHAVVRAEELVRELLFLGRPRHLTPKTLDLCDWLAETAECWRRSLRDDIAIELHLPRAACELRIDPSELETAVFGLILNVRDAMQHGGIISVTVEDFSPNGDTSFADFSGDFVAIEIAGEPARPPVAPCDEPYSQSTSEGAAGCMQFRLSQVYGFAEQAGGRVRVSGGGHGCFLFNLHLPRFNTVVSRSAGPK